MPSAWRNSPAASSASRPGAAQGKLLAEVAEDEAGRNLQLVLAEFRNYQNGIMPAGPGARELTAFFAAVDKDLAGHDTDAPRVVASDQHVLNLLSKRAQASRPNSAAPSASWPPSTPRPPRQGKQVTMARQARAFL